MDLRTVAGIVEVQGRHPKPILIQAILHDFLCKRTEILDSDLFQSTLQIALYFKDRYGDLVAGSFRTLCTAGDFVGFTVELDAVRDTPFYHLLSNFGDTQIHIQRLRKDTILQVLHRIPSHIRPTYNPRSVRSMSSSLLQHIQR